MGHAACNYGLKRKNCVFVEHTLTNYNGDNITVWKRRTLINAAKNDMKIIKCKFCGKNARALSHYWPVNGNAVCDEHLNKINEVE